MSKQYKLLTNPVPNNIWFESIQSFFTLEQWEYVKRQITQRANNHCEACHCKIETSNVKVQEEWSFNEETNVMILNRFFALCSSCYAINNINILNKEALNIAKKYLTEMENISDYAADKRIQQALERSEALSEIEWSINIIASRNHIKSVVPTTETIKNKRSENDILLNNVRNKFIELATKAELSPYQKMNLNKNANILLAGFKRGKSIESGVKNEAEHYSMIAEILDYLIQQPKEQLNNALDGFIRTLLMPNHALFKEERKLISKYIMKNYLQII